MIRAELMRYALGLEYDGAEFYGFQQQRQSPTVQAELEAALSRVADHPVGVTGSGRTDTGVHAVCQVVHFDTTAGRSERSWILGTNTHLHAGASALWLRAVPADFHARFDAIGRSYRYRILNRWVRPALARRRRAWVRRPLDAAVMHRAAQALVGEHDFSAFRAAGCQAKSPVREVKRVTVTRSGAEVILDITANAFVYHMVRNIAGSLIRVGAGEAEADWVARVLAGRRRADAGITAPPDGLYYLGPEYPAELDLPVAETVTFPVRQDAS